MASYKKTCIHCGNLIDRDARYCSFCSSRSPFGYLCPTCMRSVEKGQPLCAGCGRPLYVICPHCEKQTFVDDRCEVCGQSLLVQRTTCGAKNALTIKFCNNCGTNLSAPAPTPGMCSSCGSQNPPGVKFCGSCGAKLF
ncbi:MAG: zinc-ribbon domain-containing protein [Clostridiaceae bacterium]|jgi:predicted amidophosphoribosyltransferase|nr:zinc-ribbon domain-containing protein [Clostridiaceae bacterium]